MLIWAVGFPIGDQMLQQFAPLPLTALRMSLAAAFLVPIWVLAEGWRNVRRIDWPRALFIGGIGFGLGSFLLTFAQNRTDGVTVSVVAAAMPVAGIALECLFDGRRLSLRLVAGLCLGLIGGTVAYMSGLGSMQIGLGAVAALVSLTLFCWGSRATVLGLRGHSPLGQTAATFVGAAAVTAFAVVAQGDLAATTRAIAALDADRVVLLATYGIATIGLSQLLWIVSVSRIGVGAASMHINAAPFYVMLIVWSLGGVWSWAHAAGALIVLTGVLLIQPPARILARSG
ncbi:hypothetical protein DEA8626_00938 [Defluviimonas aquaemixtae]|uniref:EamA domain-containing protein n=2 Tax=Albidovulum aquaemixtae TaxID=1542388 RepID=A0A2R8B4G8_9RHOB|nr:hypothetical protein DEA8626_00938 [Defluviimonas aquaemixtae]